ncbi:MAG TPA: NAD(P)H-binding protein [Steroidobacteraceae bacterium]|nr:NAD(P)H-binding protein [Steroidobacteraceae bacterium]HRX90918.1 NAD(P)H-binding protein [Steroidobacteraceae bacterium]
MNSRVLIVGATGMLGAPVARRMAADGWTVRCLVRDESRARQLLGPGFEYVVGDVTQPATLDAAFDGCAAMHLNLRGGATLASYQQQEVQGSANCLAAARRQGVRRVSYLSGSGRYDDTLSHHFPVQVKQAVERSLVESGIPWTSFRATHFMESLASFVRDGRATILGRQPHPLHYLAAEDYARMVSRAFDSAAAANRRLYMWGPQAFTMRAALERYVAVRHPALRVSMLPLPVARLIARVTRNTELATVCKLFTAFAAIGEDGDPREANDLLGAPSTTLAEWLQR